MPGTTASWHQRCLISPYFQNLPRNIRIRAPIASPIVKVPKIDIHREDKRPMMPDGIGVDSGVRTGIGSGEGTRVAVDAGVDFRLPDMIIVNVPAMPGTAASMVVTPSLATTFAVMKW